jgi:hypothetical protein
LEVMKEFNGTPDDKEVTVLKVIVVEGKISS